MSLWKTRKIIAGPFDQAQHVRLQCLDSKNHGTEPEKMRDLARQNTDLTNNKQTWRFRQQKLEREFGDFFIGDDLEKDHNGLE